MQGVGHFHSKESTLFCSIFLEVKGFFTHLLKLNFIFVKRQHLGEHSHTDGLKANRHGLKAQNSYFDFRRALI